MRIPPKCPRIVHSRCAFQIWGSASMRIFGAMRIPQENADCALEHNTGCGLRQNAGTGFKYIEIADSASHIYIVIPILRVTRELLLTKVPPLCSRANAYFVFVLPLRSLMLPRCPPVPLVLCRALPQALPTALSLTRVIWLRVIWLKIQFTLLVKTLPDHHYLF